METETLDGPFYDGRVLARTYDSLDRPGGYQLGTVASPDSDQSVAYGYDAAGRLETVTGGKALLSAPHQFTYAYVPNSTTNLIESVTGPVHTVINQWEATRDVLDVKTNTAGTTLISQYDYQVNGIGQREQASTSGTAFANAFDWTWGYNSVGEVVSADHSLTAGFDRGYQYDGIGNRELAIEGDTNPQAAGATGYTANKLNQYTAIGTTAPAHDFDGNLLGDGTGRTFGWNGENRLTELRDGSNTLLATYLYDYQGRRVKKTTTASAAQGAGDTVYLYDGWNVVAEYSTLNNQLSTLESPYAFVGNNPACLVDWLSGALSVFGVVTSPLDDKNNTAVAHEQLFFEDGRSPSNIGFFDDGTLKSESDTSKFETAHDSGYDDCIMRKAVANVELEPYCLLGKPGATEKNNCQDWADDVRAEYRRLKEQM